MNGKTDQEVTYELRNQGLTETELSRLRPFKVFEGNKPTNTILIDRLNPENLGALIAMTVTAAINGWLQRDFAREWVESFRVKGVDPLGEDEVVRLWRKLKSSLHTGEDDR